MPTLFDPITLGAIEAPNRILMAPLTRLRSDDNFVPTPIMGTYYAQRAGAGLIISEATGISREGLGMTNAPGIWSEEQTEAWKSIVEQVHEAGGRILCQLWHMGRLVPSLLLGGEPPVSASAVKAPGGTRVGNQKIPFDTPRPLKLEEIPRLLDDYAKAAENAKEAGFDGIQLHAANGYLIDQFIRSTTNLRTDKYGGSIPNRCRLLLEITDRLITIWGSDRVAVRLSPNGDTQGADDATPNETFGFAATHLSKRSIAFLEFREPLETGTFGATDIPPISPHIRHELSIPLILNSDYDKHRANESLHKGQCDAISFGRPFISNPDLVERLRHDYPLTGVTPDKGAWDFAPSWYTGQEKGYIDYGAYK